MTQETKTHTKSVVDYMAPINASINENSTIQAVIQISQKATREVEQEYTFATFDLAVAKKAYALIWHDAERYKNVVIHSGVFHTVLSYLGALGKLMKGSGFEDIITEAGLCASGSLDKMMNVDIITEHLEYIPSCWKPLKDCSSLHLSKIQDQ